MELILWLVINIVKLHSSISFLEILQIFKKVLK